MCSSKLKLHNQSSNIPSSVAKINGRPVLQPTCNQVPSLERRKSLPKSLPKTPTSPTSTCKTKTSLLSPPVSPKLPSPRPPALKRGKDPNELNSSAEKVLLTPRSTTKLRSSAKKSKKACGVGAPADTSLKYASSLIVEAPGSIAAARREQVAIMQEQRRMKIAHYGRTKSAKYEGKVVPLLDSSPSSTSSREQKRCSFITPNSGMKFGYRVSLNIS
nr:uncharacterized protein LOC125421178 [Ziziphus jujuba var. spinosa]